MWKISSVLLACCMPYGSMTVGAQEVPDGVSTLDYTDNGVELQGYLALPANKTTAPVVVIIPDWDGVNEYEIQRATMVANELGYVGFAADIYGKDLHTVEDIDQRRQLAGLYRGNATLFSERIQSAVDTVRTLDSVDGENVALIGYCFGGTGVLSYAMTGVNDVNAVVSFHGGLGGLPEAGPAVEPKILVLSGGDDDATTDIMDLETSMDAANATWEITRYSGIEHAFTVFSDDRYNERADMRSWNSMRTFLLECFGEMEFEPTGPTDVSVESISYTDVDGTELLSYLAMPSMEWQRPLPTVVIIPDWDGNNEYEQQRATLLSELGYIGFAADIYGADLQNDLSLDQRIALTTEYRSNSTLFVQRMERAIEEVKTFEGVDSDNIAVIGYCFGGTGIVELAFSGSQDPKAVVAFHGGLQTLPSAATSVTPYTLILSGGDDDAHGNQTELEAALNDGEADWEITRYSGVVHGFTAWDSASAYSLVADYRSWESMLTAFSEIMPPPTMVASEGAAAPGEDAMTAMPTASPTATTTTSTTAPVVATADATSESPTASPTAAPVDGTTSAAASLVSFGATTTAFLLMLKLL